MPSRTGTKPTQGTGAQAAICPRATGGILHGTTRPRQLSTVAIQVKTQHEAASSMICDDLALIDKKSVAVHGSLSSILGRCRSTVPSANRCRARGRAGMQSSTASASSFSSVEGLALFLTGIHCRTLARARISGDRRGRTCYMCQPRRRSR